MARCFTCRSAAPGKDLIVDVKTNDPTHAWLDRAGIEDRELRVAAGLIVPTPVFRCAHCHEHEEVIELYERDEVSTFQAVPWKSVNKEIGDDLRNIADALRHRGLPERAIPYYREAILRFPLDYRSYIGLADAHLRHMDFGSATEVYLDSIPHAPATDAFDFRSFSHRQLGRINGSFERWETAEREVMTAIQYTPGYAMAFWELSQYRAQLGGDWRSPLGEALRLKPELWYFVDLEPMFTPVSADLTAFLSETYQSAVEAGQAAYERASAAVERAEAQIAATSAFTQAAYGRKRRYRA